MGKFKKSYHLVIETFNIMKKDPEILIFPILNCLIFLFFCFSIFYINFHGNYNELDKIIEGFMNFEPDYYFLIIIIYLFGYFTTYFFQAGLMFIVDARIHNKNLSFKDGLMRSLTRLPEIFLLSLIQSTVGIILRWIFEKVSALNKIIVALVGATWSIATFFVLPNVVLEDNSLTQSFKESIKVFRKTWGETIIINFSTTVFFDVVFRVFSLSYFFFIVFLDNLGFLPSFSWAVIFAMFGIALIAFLQSAIDGTFKVVLYEYAKTGIIPKDFDQETVACALTSYFKEEEKIIFNKTVKQGDNEVERINYPKNKISKKKYLIISILIFLGVAGFAILKGSPRNAKNIQVEGNHLTMTLEKQNITVGLETKTKKSFLVNSGKLSSLNTGEFNVITMEKVKYLEQKYTDFIHCDSPGEEEGKNSLIHVGFIVTTLNAEKEMKKIEELYKNGGNLVVIEIEGFKLDGAEDIKREISNYGIFVVARVKPEMYYLVDDIKIIDERYQK